MSVRDASTPLRVSFCWPDTKAEPWLAALRAALPQAQFSSWQPGDPQADYAVVWSPTQQFLDEQPGLKAIFNTGAGVDALLQRRLPDATLVVRLDDAGMGVQMAEYVCQAVTRYFREIDACEADMKRGQWTYRKPRNRADCTVGILGLGVLGQRVARALQAFDYPVAGWSRSPKSLPGVQCHAGATQLSAFLSATRVLVCLLPLTPDTEGILRRETLQQLQPGGYLINVARGAHLVDEDLVALVNSGHLAGATLDVFRTEPLPASHVLRGHPAITLTPHMSARTLRDETVGQIAGKIMALERGEPIAGVVDRLRGY